MIKIPITEEDLEQARVLTEDMFKSGVVNRFGYNDTKRKEQIEVGLLGQLKFKKYLDSLNIKHEFHLYNKSGLPTYYNFIIDGKTIDFRNTKIKWGYAQKFIPIANLLITEDQIKHPANIYIQGFVDDEFLYIAGYIENSQTQKYPIGKKGAMIYPARMIPVLELTPIDKLLGVKHGNA